jgi:hypothetical protein
MWPYYEYISQISEADFSSELPSTPCQVRSLPPRHGASSGCGWRNGLQLWRLAANILNKQPRTNNKGWSSSLGLGLELTTLHLKKKKFVTRISVDPQTCTDSLDKRPKRRNMNVRIELWTLEKWNGVMLDWISLAQDRNRWRSHVNSVMSLRVP